MSSWKWHKIKIIFKMSIHFYLYLKLLCCCWSKNFIRSFLKNRAPSNCFSLSLQHSLVFPKVNLSFSRVLIKNKHLDCICLGDLKVFLIFSKMCYLCFFICLTSILSDNFTSSWKSKHFFPLKKCIKLQKHEIQSLNKTKQTNLKIFVNFKSFKIHKSVHIRLQEFKQYV